MQKALLLFRLSATAPAAATTAPSPPPPAAFTPTYLHTPATPGYGVKKREPGNLNAAASGSALEKLLKKPGKKGLHIASGIPSLFRGSCSFIYLFIYTTTPGPTSLYYTYTQVHTHITYVSPVRKYLGAEVESRFALYVVTYIHTYNIRYLRRYYPTRHYTTLHYNHIASHRILASELYLLICRRSFVSLAQHLHN